MSTVNFTDVVDIDAINFAQVAEFLLTRFAEDAAVAERCVQRNNSGNIFSWHPYRHQLTDADLPSGNVAVPAPGFLAECVAKRDIVREIAFDATGVALSDSVLSLREIKVLLLLAAPYAQHPDFDRTWALDPEAEFSSVRWGS